MDIGYARINMAYMGGVEQLREALGGAGLSLTNRGGQWMLAEKAMAAMMPACAEPAFGAAACWRRPWRPG